MNDVKDPPKYNSNNHSNVLELIKYTANNGFVIDLENEEECIIYNTSTILTVDFVEKLNTCLGNIFHMDKVKPQNRRIESILTLFSYAGFKCIYYSSKIFVIKKTKRRIRNYLLHDYKDVEIDIEHHTGYSSSIRYGYGDNFENLYK